MLAQRADEEPRARLERREEEDAELEEGREREEREWEGREAQDGQGRARDEDEGLVQEGPEPAGRGLSAGSAVVRVKADKGSGDSRVVVAQGLDHEGEDGRTFPCWHLVQQRRRDARVDGVLYGGGSNVDQLDTHASSEAIARAEGKRETRDAPAR